MNKNLQKFFVVALLLAPIMILLYTKSHQSEWDRAALIANTYKTKSPLTKVGKDTYEIMHGIVREDIDFGWKLELKEALEIQKIEVSCGCTTPNVSVGQKLTDGDSIQVTIDLSSKLGGASRETIIIRGDKGRVLRLTHMFFYAPPTHSKPKAIVFNQNTLVQEFSVEHFLDTRAKYIEFEGKHSDRVELTYKVVDTEISRRFDFVAKIDLNAFSGTTKGMIVCKYKSDADPISETPFIFIAE